MATTVAAHYPHQQQPSSRYCGGTSSSNSNSSRSHKMVQEIHDPFYGHRAVSEMCESVITALFACPLDSTSSSVNGPSSATSRPPPRLAEFIGYALHRTRLPEEITFQALFLLRRLKSRFPAARGSSGHRLFISALMLASKSSCDDTYSNKSWTIVSQGLFSLREVNQMERELFGYLGFKVNVEIEDLNLFRSLLLAGDLASVVELSSPLPSPNPQVVIASPPLDRGCDTPIAADSTPRKSASVDATVMSRAASSGRQYTRASSLSNYAVDLHQAASSSSSNISPRNATSTASKTASVYSQNGNVSYNLSPSNVSAMSSSRGSISSASGYSMTPSPSSVSHSEASGSSRTSPDTPPSELCGSPWNNGEVDAKTAMYHGEPAGSYDQAHMDFYQHLKNTQQFYGQGATYQTTRFRQQY